MKAGLDDGQIIRKAFEWSVDYKPFDDRQSPQEHAAYGYGQGYKQAMADKANSFEGARCGDAKGMKRIAVLTNSQLDFTEFKRNSPKGFVYVKVTTVEDLIGRYFDGFIALRGASYSIAERLINDGRIRPSP